MLQIIFKSFVIQDIVLGSFFLAHNLWLPLNDLMVQFGQNICKPINPQHDECPFTEYCLEYMDGIE